MAKVNVSLPQGTRDFGPDVVRKRNSLLNTIKTVFELYGFQPLETPAMENIETLMGKYGEDGDKLIFRILDSGNPFKEDFIKSFAQFLKQHHEFYLFVSQSKRKKIAKKPKSPYSIPFWEIDPKEIASLLKKITEEPQYAKYLPEFKNEFSSKALKYDLTIPFARFVAMNINKLILPFKRYQIQPVWRADKPQKGRYREFYQCDVDVVGSKSLLNEVELITIYWEVFSKLNVPVTIVINNRKILNGIIEQAKVPSDSLNDILSAIDEFDKVGFNNALWGLRSKGLTNEQVESLRTILSSLMTKSTLDTIDSLEQKFENKSEIGLQGIKEIRQIIKSITQVHKNKLHIFNPKDDIKIHTDPYSPYKVNQYGFLKSDKFNLHFDITLARGLNYYTGTILEVRANTGSLLSSIGGGGRYDDLTGLFGVPNIPGVGVSFGVDRIYDVMEELGLFREEVHIGTQVLFFNLGENESRMAFVIAQQLRTKGIRCELYHESSKMDKQFKYAEKKNIPFVIIIGEKELQQNTCNVKDIRSGIQQTINLEKLAEYEFLP